MFVVTGCPRSATQFASTLFTALRCDCPHERAFVPRANLQDVLRWGRDRRQDRGESSWLAWAFLPVMPVKIPVLHSIRNPWKVAESLAFKNHILHPQAAATMGAEAIRDVIRDYCPQVFEWPKAAERAASFVVRWNALIEEVCQQNGNPYMTFQPNRVLVDGDVIRTMLRHVGIERTHEELAWALALVREQANIGHDLEFNVDLPPAARNLLSQAMRQAKRLINPDHPEAKTYEHPETIPMLQTVSDDNGRPPLRELLPGELARDLDALAVRYGYDAEANEQTKEDAQCQLQD